MKTLKLCTVASLSLLVLACSSTRPMNPLPENVAKPAPAAPMKTNEVEAHIKRIEEKMQQAPDVKGWLLIGDAYMHLKRYDDAVIAYKEAYMLSDYADGPKQKMKTAMYYSVKTPSK